jgi:hypothetical protein
MSKSRWVILLGVAFMALGFYLIVDGGEKAIKRECASYFARARTAVDSALVVDASRLRCEP